MELSEKEAKLDTDPGLWMALTLAKDSYMTLLAAKKTPPEESGPHHERMQAMLKAFQAQPDYAGLGLFGAVDIGQGAYWWDYGQLKLYFANNIRVTEVRPGGRTRVHGWVGAWGG